MTDQDGSDSSALASVWKRAKQSIKPKRFPSVSSKPTGPTKMLSRDDAVAAAKTTAKDKAELRRAQVRRAQIQHRQRKANYARQLELDMAGLRKLIADAAKGCQALAAENDSIRRRLGESGGSHLAWPATAPQAPRHAAGSFGGINAGSVAVSLDMDDMFHAPAYQVSGTPSLCSAEGGDGLQHCAADYHGRPFMSFPEMTPEETQAAINFILALEHVCWDHFGHNDFVSASDDTGAESGHTMMATSLALQSAPQALFEAMGEVGARAKAAACPEPLGAAPSWQASGLTLRSLHSMALSLNPSDLEVTPVQAWFELASLYPPSLLSRREIMDALKKECFGVVKCLHYGAVMERGAWDAMVGRVMGPQLRAEYV